MATLSPLLCAIPLIWQFIFLEPAGQRAHVAVKCRTATVLCCYEHNDQKHFGEERVYLVFMPHHSPPLREVRAELRQERRHCFCCSPCLAQFIYFIFFSTQDYLYRVWSCIQWAGSIHTNYQSRECHSVAKASLMDACSQSRYPLH